MKDYKLTDLRVSHTLGLGQVLTTSGTSERGVDSCVSWALPFNITEDNKAAVSFFSASYYSGLYYYITDSAGQDVKITSISRGNSLPITASVLEGAERGLNSRGVYKPGVLHLADTDKNTEAPDHARFSRHSEHAAWFARRLPST